MPRHSLGLACVKVNKAKDVRCDKCQATNYNRFVYHKEMVHYPTAKLHPGRSWDTNTFELLGRTWQLMLFPTGNQQQRHFSAYLKLMGVAPDETLRVHFSIGVVHPAEVQLDTADMRDSPNASYSDHTFSVREPDRGFVEIFDLSKVMLFLDAKEALCIQVGIAPFIT
jgi:hypothetical protein